MADAALPADWDQLYAAAAAAGWSIGASNPGHLAGWTYHGARFDGTTMTARRAFGDAGALRRWIQGGCVETTLDEYRQFLAQKRVTASKAGFAPAAPLHDRLFGFQRDIVSWALEQGKAAIFADTGLGKTAMQLEWARHVAAHTRGRVLILAPLAVAHQTIAEAALMGLDVAYVKSQGDADADDAHQVFITNYDRIDSFIGDAWHGVVLDESSILKAYTGKTKQALLATFARTPFRLACTATPAPNDYIELGNHAEFLGVMPSNEMLMRWFINDTMKAGGYRLKGHAEGAFWAWVASWAACVSKPSDLGHSDAGYDLPPLDVRQHHVAADVQRLMETTGSFIAAAGVSATGLWKDKAETAPARVARTLQLVAAEPDEAWLLWVSTDAEADLLRAQLPAALTVEVRGSVRPEAKEAKLNAFTTGAARYLITKPRIAGFGMNWQHCARMVFVGITYSFEYLYQALRRCYRFGQQRPVQAHLIVAETEANVIATVQAKQAAHRAMQAKMTAAMRETGLLAGRGVTLVKYDAPRVMTLPRWLATKKEAA